MSILSHLTYDQSLSLYLHVPFCSTKCTYCAFNTYTNVDHLINPFVQALDHELIITGRQAGDYTVKTVYFGGGTPSLLTAAHFDTLMGTIAAHFNLAGDAEITIEANPNDINDTYLQALRANGINRLSIGMQARHQRALDLFGRRHEYAEVVKVVESARTAGFDNLSLDLIYGFPGQKRKDWQETLDAALSLQPEHISLYALGLEDGTPMQAWVEQGRLRMPDDDTVADMYDAATTAAALQGYEQYEISNWARPGCESRHNIQYWRNWPYLGLGPGAHGYAENVRYATVRSPWVYIRQLAEDDTTEGAFPLTPAVDWHETVDRTNQIIETLITNLRLLHEGVNRYVFRQQFSQDVMEIYGTTLSKYARYGLLDISDEAVRITEKGRLLSNAVFRDLMQS